MTGSSLYLSEGEKKPVSTRLTISIETKHPQSTKNRWEQSNYRSIVLHAALLSSAARSGFSSPPVWRGPVPLPFHNCAHSKVLHVRYQIKSFLSVGFGLRLITLDRVNGCVTLLGFCAAYVANLIRADWEVCVSLQPKYSLPCFPSVVHYGVNGPSVFKAANLKINMSISKVGSEHTSPGKSLGHVGNFWFESQSFGQCCFNTGQHGKMKSSYSHSPLR